MLARLVENLRLLFALAITRVELAFWLAWARLKARCGMRKEDRHGLPSPSVRGARAVRKTQERKPERSQRVTNRRGKRNAAH